MPALMVAGIAILVSAACATPTSEPGESSALARPEIPYSTQWSAGDRIDIQARPAELVRATVDGGAMAAWAGVDHSFPGYATAVANAREYNDFFGSTTQKPNPRNLSLAMQHSVFRRHIATLSATDTHITARVCTLERVIKPFSAPTPTTGEGSFIGETHPKTLDVELTKAADASPGTPGERDASPDQDPRGNNQPSWNVYGDWTITAIHNLYGENNTFGTEPECVAWWKQLFPGWTSVTRPGDFRPPHPVNGPWEWYNLLALDPPAPPSYPEWIAPKGADA